MLRKMCKECAPKGSDNYLNRKLTGVITEVTQEVTRVTKQDENGNVCGVKDYVSPTKIKTMTCTNCGRQWKFSSRYHYHH